MASRTFLVLTAALLLTPAMVLGQPQVSAADKAAARDLFNEGYQLQQAGKFGEALDRFQRSYDTFNAPTTALHVAECQAALLKLVEAAETYRGVAHLELDPSSPEAYKQARDQAQAELAQIEPRIPHLTIKVTPANAPGLLVTLDGQTVKPALVGVARPINPGVHKVTAVASGYLQAEQTIDVKERTTPSIPINLQPGGVVYTPVGPNPNPNPPPNTGNGPPNTYTPPPNPNPNPVNPSNPNNTQFNGGFGTEWQVPTRRYSRMSFIFGADFAAIIPTGDITNGKQFSAYAGAGFGVTANVAFRFARYFLIGGFVGGGGMGAGNGLDSGSNPVQANGWSTFLIGPYLGYIGNPEGFGFYGEIGGNYRQINTDPTTTSGASSISPQYSGGEFLLGLGFHIRAGTYIRLMPKIQMFVGSFNKDASSNINGSQVHAFFNFGLSGFFDLDVDKPPPPKGNTASQ